MFDKYNTQVMTIAALGLTTVTVLIIPISSSLALALSMAFLVGVGLGALDTGRNLHTQQTADGYASQTVPNYSYYWYFALKPIYLAESFRKRGMMKQQNHKKTQIAKITLTNAA